MAERTRLIELTAALSLATDAGTGQPFEHALRTAVLAARCGDALGLGADERSVVLHTSLLRFFGCTSDATGTALLAGGDEIAFNAAMAPVVMADDREAVPHLVRHLGEELPLLRRAGRIASALSHPGGKAQSLAAHCEVGARLAARIGLPAGVVAGVAHAYERWDGAGLPAGLAGDDIPIASRIAVVARDVDLTFARTGIEGVHAAFGSRRGRAYAPDVTDVFSAEAENWLAELEQIDPWDAVLDAEQQPAAEVTEGDLDDVLLAVADFVDMKSPWFVDHSRGVAVLAGAAAQGSGLAATEVALARRAALVHDLGIVAVPAGVWNRAGPLTREGWERVRTHPHVADRILLRCEALKEVAAVASAHHERLDGSGYHRGSRDESTLAQIVAAADIYRACCEDRPHRPRMAPEAAAQALVEEVERGRLGRAAVDSVLAAAGLPRSLPGVPRPAGLTEREVDVLRLIARGRTNKEAARELGISTRTVGSHVEHIYAKAGVTTRAAATLFAMENELLHA